MMMIVALLGSLYQMTVAALLVRRLSQSAFGASQGDVSAMQHQQVVYQDGEAASWPGWLGFSSEGCTHTHTGVHATKFVPRFRFDRSVAIGSFKDDGTNMY